MKLHASVASLGDAQSDLDKQLEGMVEGMQDREKALIFPLTSLAFADAYFFAEAAGRINPRLLEAKASYLDAQRAAEFADRMALAGAKLATLRVREIQAIDFPNDHSSPTVEEIRASPLDEFRL